MLTKAERIEKAHRHFVSTWGEEIGTKKWKEYCEKSGLLEKPKEKTKKKGSKESD